MTNKITDRQLRKRTKTKKEKERKENSFSETGIKY